MTHFLHFRFPGLAKIHCAFQMRTVDNLSSQDDEMVGCDIVELFSSLQQYGLLALTKLNQIHGEQFIFEPEAVSLTASSPYNGDGMSGTLPGLGLMIKTADCQPVLLTDSEGKYIAALHVGWRGNKINFLQSAIEKFCQRYHLEPANLLAVRGPSLSPPKAEFINFADEWGEEFATWFDPVAHTMDLWSLTRHQLHQAGLPLSHIYGLDFCTYSNREFFSYRRARHKQLTNCGRQANLIWIAKH